VDTVFLKRLYVFFVTEIQTSERYAENASTTYSSTVNGTCALSRPSSGATATIIVRTEAGSFHPPYTTQAGPIDLTAPINHRTMVSGLVNEYRRAA
jgi:hypothetical protein